MIRRPILLLLTAACLFFVPVPVGRCAADPSVADQLHRWLTGPVRVTVRNEATGAAAAFQAEIPVAAERPPCRHQLGALQLTMAELFSPTERGMAWDLGFGGRGPRTGHEVTMELPLLAPERRIFTPSERAKLEITLADGQRRCVARWTPNEPAGAADGINTTVLSLVWQPAE
jgi:hypothetical protein